MGCKCSIKSQKEEEIIKEEKKKGNFNKPDSDISKTPKNIIFYFIIFIQVYNICYYYD